MKYSLEELVNVEEEALKLSVMIDEATGYAKAKADDYGIEIVDTQIRVLNYPDSNKQSVYDRMKTKRRL